MNNSQVEVEVGARGWGGWGEGGGVLSGLSVEIRND